MKYTLFAAAFCLLLASFAFTQSSDGINIIPKPQSVSAGKGMFTVSKKTKILAMSDAGRRFGAILNDLLKRNYGFELETTNKPQSKNVVQFAVIANSGTPGAMPEGHSLKVTPDVIQLSLIHISEPTRPY